MIKIEELSYAYGSQQVLQGLTFDIARGDFCALIGHNGSGKSTLLKLMAGILKPERRGSVLLDGLPIESHSSQQMAQLLAWVPQRQNVLFDFTVYDTVMMGRHPYQARWASPSANDKAVVESMLARTNLLDLKHRMLSQLSGGELQRTMIARAMAQQTPILLLDEPLSNLDVAHKFEIMDILRQLNSQTHTTIVIILHDFAFVKQYASHTLILNEGKLQDFGTTDAVFHIANLRTAFQLSESFLLDELGNISRRDTKIL